MGFLKKVFGGVKKHVKKITKGIMKAMKPMGKVIGKVMKPFGKIMNKLGPVGSMALMFILPMALPAIWGSFGTAVSGMTGPLGSLLKGVHAVGSAAGNVYSTVTGAISDTIGKIAGNTIGKIPLGAERTVGSTYNDFTSWAARTMEGRNLNMTGKMSEKGFNSANELGLKNAEFLKSDGYLNAKAQFDSQTILDSSGVSTDSLLRADTRDVFTGFEQKQTLINPVSGPIKAGAKITPPQYVTELKANYVSVPTDLVTDAMASNTQKAINYGDVVNNYASTGISNQGINQGANAFKQAGKEIGVLQSAQELASPTPEPVPVAYSKALASDALALARANDVTTIDAAPMDFAGLSSSYATAGYGAFSNPQEQYQAGAYGGGAFNNQVALRMLAPTVALPTI